MKFFRLQNDCIFLKDHGIFVVGRMNPSCVVEVTSQLVLICDREVLSREMGVDRNDKDH